MMFSPFVSVPTESDAREDAPKSHLVTKKDLKRWAIILVLFFALVGYPLYGYIKKMRDRHVCAGNLNSISKALALYANDHDDRYPPLASMDPSTGMPYVENGTVNTWVTQIFRYDQRPEIYRCPAATEDELVPNQAAIKEGDTWKLITVYSSYGMYAAYSAANQSLIDRQSQVVFIAETSNFGSQNSYDPLKFLDSGGQTIPYDGFSVAWDNSNVAPTTKTKKIARLAFPGSDSGEFANARGRHGDVSFSISPDGNLLPLPPREGVITMRGGQPTGRWQTPPMGR